MFVYSWYVLEPEQVLELLIDWTKPVNYIPCISTSQKSQPYCIQYKAGRGAIANQWHDWLLWWEGCIVCDLCDSLQWVVLGTVKVCTGCEGHCGDPHFLYVIVTRWDKALENVNCNLSNPLVLALHSQFLPSNGKLHHWQHPSSHCCWSRPPTDSEGPPGFTWIWSQLYKLRRQNSSACILPVLGGILPLWGPCCVNLVQM